MSNPDLPLQGLRVLVVEDNFVVARSIQWVLEGLGCTVAGPVPNAEQALELIEGEHVDAGILDIDLQGSTSAEVAQRLNDAGIAVVFLTGYDSAGRLPEELQRLPVLSKPVDASRVADAILEERGRLAGTPRA